MEPGTITELLASDLEGRDVVDRLVPLVYRELRGMARNQLSRHRAATVQTTTLVHEAYLKLAGGQPLSPESRAHFFGAAARAMRQVLVDAARRRNALKRGSGEKPHTLDEAQVGTEVRIGQVLDVDRVLERLAGEYPRQARVVECRFFAGLSVDETAETLGLSVRTVKRDWALAKAWLYRELSSDPEAA